MSSVGSKHLRIQEKMHYELYPIDPKNKKDVAAISKLHHNLLDWGPIAKLGYSFLKDFVYSHLIKDGFLRAAMFNVNGESVGFIAYTPYSKNFMGNVIQKHRFKLIPLLLKSILYDPLILARMYRAMRLMLTLRPTKNQKDHPEAEIMAIGVLPEYRSAQFIYETGLHISHDLFMHAVTYFKSIGLDRMHLFVDEFNKPVIYFYRFLGGKIEEYKRAGQSMVRVWFDLDKLSI